MSNFALANLLCMPKVTSLNDHLMVMANSLEVKILIRELSKMAVVLRVKKIKYLSVADHSP